MAIVVFLFGFLFAEIGSARGPAQRGRGGDLSDLHSFGAGVL
jgi:hypothetical protein